MAGWMVGPDVAVPSSTMRSSGVSWPSRCCGLAGLGGGGDLVQARGPGLGHRRGGAQLPAQGRVAACRGGQRRCGPVCHVLVGLDAIPDRLVVCARALVTDCAAVVMEPAVSGTSTGWALPNRDRPRATVASTSAQVWLSDMQLSLNPWSGPP